MEEASTLCPACGAKVLQSEKVCSKCGAVNYRNIEVRNRVISENQKYIKTAKKINKAGGILKVFGILLIVFGVLVDIVTTFLLFTDSGSELFILLPFGTIAFIVGMAILSLCK